MASQVASERFHEVLLEAVRRGGVMGAAPDDGGGDGGDDAGGAGGEGDAGGGDAGGATGGGDDKGGETQTDESGRKPGLLSVDGEGEGDDDKGGEGGGNRLGRPRATDRDKEAKKDEGGDSEGFGSDDLEIKLPDGFESADQEMLDGFKAVAKEHGLDSSAASAVANWYLEQQSKAAEAQEEALDTQITKQNEKWEREISDKYGEELPSKVQNAKKALRKFGGQPAADALYQMGIDNHPVLFGLMAAVGEAMAEDNSDAGGGPGGGGPLSRDQRLAGFYSQSQSKKGK